MSDLPDPRPGDLTPCVQTALVTLRRGGLTVRELHTRLAEATTDETRSLLAAMQLVGLIAPIGDIWYLEEVGVSWLARRGLSVRREHTHAGAEAPEITL